MATTMDGTTTEATEATEETGGDFSLAQPYAVPSEGSFRGMEFVLDAGLATIARDLIDEFADDFWYLRGADIEWAWKRRGGAMNGKVLHHGHQRSSPRAVAHGAKEFVVWIAADASRETAVTLDLIRAMLCHEFCHFRKNEDGELKITGHSFEGFPLEVRLFGLWQQELRNAARSFQGRIGDLTDEDEPAEDLFGTAADGEDGEDTIGNYPPEGDLSRDPDRLYAGEEAATKAPPVAEG